MVIKMTRRYKVGEVVSVLNHMSTSEIRECNSNVQSRIYNLRGRGVGNAYITDGKIIKIQKVKNSGGNKIYVYHIKRCDGIVVKNTTSQIRKVKIHRKR